MITQIGDTRFYLMNDTIEEVRVVKVKVKDNMITALDANLDYPFLDKDLICSVYINSSKTVVEECENLYESKADLVVKIINDYNNEIAIVDNASNSQKEAILTNYNAILTGLGEDPIIVEEEEPK